MDYHSIHDNPKMETNKKTYELLLKEINAELNTEPKDRKAEYTQYTLDYFLNHDRTTEDHDLWRECYMHEELLGIMDRRFMALNPHFKRQSKIMAALKDDKLNKDKWKILYEYEQEVDEERRTQKEIDASTKLRYPSINKRELEIQAAENYINAKWGTGRRIQVVEKEPEEECLINTVNTNPVLSWQNYKNQVMNNLNSDSKERNAVQRSIEKYFNKQPLPWPIRERESEYQIVDYGNHEKRGRPTPRYCKYQKIQLG
jgi:hypothetical protein